MVLNIFFFYSQRIARDKVLFGRIRVSRQLVLKCQTRFVPSDLLMTGGVSCFVMFLGVQATPHAHILPCFGLVAALAAVHRLLPACRNSQPVPHLHQLKPKPFLLRQSVTRNLSHTCTSLRGSTNLLTETVMTGRQLCHGIACCTI